VRASAAHIALLISAFAIPISLSITLLVGLSCIVVMAVLVFVMFSPEQDIIAEDTGPAANMAAIAAAANAYFTLESTGSITGHCRTNLS
jgi:hypothetical protein